MSTFTLHNTLWSKLLIGAAALIMAYDPINWLIGTWVDPSYASSGFILFLLSLGLFIWSISSQKIVLTPINAKIPLILLMISAAIRLIGQLFAINMIGALTIVVDIYAIAKLCGLDVRRRALSPFWLAVCFAFSLPFERIVQRLFGYGLQNLSADGACTILKSTFDNVSCQGVRILINTQDVLVDLPCSGARASLLLLLLFSVCAAVSRFTFKQASLGIFVALISAYLINVLRICVLAACIGYPEYIGHLDVMSQPAHDIIGLFLLSLGAVPIILWARYFYRPIKVEKELPRALRVDGWWLEQPQKQKPNYLLASGFILLAILIINMPRTAVDVAKKDLLINLPLVLNDHFAVPVPLLAKEETYFTQYGGSAQKATYGDHTLMIVRTSAPLRHLHAPDDCLRGLGMDVEYRGVQYAPLPTAIYKATDHTGTAYRVAVSFISSDQNHMTTNVSEAVWRWIQNPSDTWMAVQRISPWSTPSYDNSQFDNAVMASLEISNAPLQLAQLQENSND